MKEFYARGPSIRPSIRRVVSHAFAFWHILFGLRRVDGLIRDNQGDVHTYGVCLKPIIVEVFEGWYERCELLKLNCYEYFLQKKRKLEKKREKEKGRKGKMQRRKRREERRKRRKEEEKKGGREEKRKKR